MAVAAKLSEARQLTVIDEALKFARQHQTKAFAFVGEAYLALQVPFADEVRRLEEVALAASHTYAARGTYQQRVQAEAQDLDAGIDKAADWGDDLGGALAWAATRNHPLARRLATVCLGGHVRDESYRRASHDLLQILTAIEQEGGLAGLPLPTDFLAEGRAIHAELQKDAREAAEAEANRKAATSLLHLQIDEIARILTELEALRPAAARRAKRDILGFDFSLLAADVATPGAGAADAAPADGALPAFTTLPTT